MTHLTPQELISALDGALDRERQAHADTCDACRRELRDLDAIMTKVADASNVPEPSPLFWDHFTARVREAVSEEAVPTAQSWWRAAWAPLVVVMAVVICAATVVAVKVRQRTPAAAPAAVITVADAPDDDLSGTSDEGSATAMAAAMGDLSWDQAREANLVPTRYTVDSAVASLTDAQRRELIRLVQEAIRRGE
jgi:hypothetical protein